MRVYKLSNEMLISILIYLDLKDITKFLLTSKPLFKKLSDSSFLLILMKQLSIMKITHLSILPNVVAPFFHKIYKIISFGNPKTSQKVPWLPLDSSSTHKNQSIYRTIQGMSGFWSSLPCPNGDQDQFLLYDLGNKFYESLLTKITIEFQYFAYVFQGDQVLGPSSYLSHEIQIEMGFHPNNPIFTQSLKIEQPKQGFQPIFEIPIFPQVIFARFIKIKFIGMRSRHVLKDNMYYLCVDKVLPEIIFCKDIDFGTLNQVLEETYNKTKIEKSECKRASNSILGISLPNYIADISQYNELLVKKMNQGISEKDEKKFFEEIIETNSQLKIDKSFFGYLMNNPTLSDIYLEFLFHKQMHLNYLETLLFLHMSIDWEKMNPFTNNNFLKNEKYFHMFWIYYFNEDKVQKYILNVFEKNSKIAFDLIGNVETSSFEGIEEHEPLELKKLLLLGALQKHNTVPASKPF